MSTSDPDRPADDTTSPADESTATEPATPDASVAPDAQNQPLADETPAAAPVVKKPVVKEPVVEEPVVEEPVVEKPVVEEPVVEKPVVEKPVVKEPVVATTAVVDPVVETPAVEAPATSEPVSLDTGRHAVVRPTPVPPEDVAAPKSVVATAPVVAEPVTPAPVVDPTLAAAAAASTASEPVAPAPAPPTTPEPITPAPITPEPEADGRLFPDPNAPRSPSAGSHVLGVIVGLILTPIAVAVLLLGESQILEAQADGWDATTSVFGITLVTLGLLLLGCVLLLGLWTAAVPITGGALLTVVGAVYLYAPSIAREQTLNVLTSSGWHLTITQVTVAGTSGMVLAAGFLLLLAGLVIASARRRGIHLGEFRERHKI